MYITGVGGQVGGYGCSSCGGQDLQVLEGDEATFDHVGGAVDLQIRRGYRCEDCGNVTMMAPPGRDEDRPTHR